jgi:ParB-like chromosome segregation protein Spo0J
VVIAGHGRILAAKRMAMDDAPCIVLAGLTEAQKRAYRIADNKLPLNAGWDDELLKLELLDLREMDFNVELTGFDMTEFDELFQAGTGSGVAMGSLVEKFGVPPFTILDARQG